jgi:hypothetical protein
MSALSAEDRQELIRLEEGMWRAETRYDSVFQAERFAPDFFEFGRSGRIYTRDEAILGGGGPILAVLPLQNLRVRLLDSNTAQITYDSEVKYGDKVEYGRRSSIWSRTERGWVMRFHQGTPYESGGEG